VPESDQFLNSLGCSSGIWRITLLRTFWTVGLAGWGNIPARSPVHIFRIKIEVVAQPALFCREPICPHITCYFFRRATEMDSFSAEAVVTESWQMTIKPNTWCVFNIRKLSGRKKDATARTLVEPSKGFQYHCRLSRTMNCNVPKRTRNEEGNIAAWSICLND
jgi:hypothetical protein